MTDKLPKMVTITDLTLRWKLSRYAIQKKIKEDDSFPSSVQLVSNGKMALYLLSDIQKYEKNHPWLCNPEAFLLDVISQNERATHHVNSRSENAQTTETHQFTAYLLAINPTLGVEFLEIVELQEFLFSDNQEYLFPLDSFLAKHKVYHDFFTQWQKTL